MSGSVATQLAHFEAGVSYYGTRKETKNDNRERKTWQQRSIRHVRIRVPKMTEYEHIVFILLRHFSMSLDNEVTHFVFKKQLEGDSTLGVVALPVVNVQQMLEIFPVNK